MVWVGEPFDCGGAESLEERRHFRGSLASDTRLKQEKG